MNTVELVVARHAEDLGWLRRVPKLIRVTVYNKGGAGPDHAVALPNVGREAHTYLHHVVQRYDELADATVFCQGKPFDHVPDLHKILQRLVRLGNSGGTASGRPIRTGGACPSSNALNDVTVRLRENGFLWLGFLIDRDDRAGSLLFQNWTKNSGRRPLSMDGFWKEFWNSSPPGEYVFYPGGNFVVTRDQVRCRPRSFYEKALEVSGTFPDAAHCFERTWDTVFGVNGIPVEHRNKPLPIYFKPIRRLVGPQGE